MTYIPETIYLDDGADGDPLARDVLRRFPGVPVRRAADIAAITAEIARRAADPFGAGKRHLVLTRHKGSFLKKCPGVSKGMVCCNYYVLNLVKNCVYDCAYCFLQDFMGNNPVMSAIVNIEDLFAELDEIFTRHPDRLFRVGTGELTDSLVIDDILPYSDHLVPFFRKYGNAVLELKTKSVTVDNLLKFDGARNIIVAWSLNPQDVIDREEKGTPSLAARLAAARRCQARGFRLAFHFDPIILFPGWEESYAAVAEQLFREIPAAAVEWISLGSFRYRPALKPVVKERHPDTRLFTGEHVKCEDGKFRYLRPLRDRAYETMRAFLHRYGADLKIYMCMETKEVWNDVTGKSPRSNEKLDQLFDM